MSLTSLISPGDLSPSRNPVYWKFSSSNINTEYILLETKLDGITYPIEIYPKAPDGYFYVNIQRQIESCFAGKEKINNWFPAAPGLSVVKNETDALLVYFSVKAWEVIISGSSIANHYIGDAGPGTGTPDYTSGSDHLYCIRAARQHEDLPDLSAYKQLSENKFLTHMPLSRSILPNVPHCLYYYLKSNVLVGTQINLRINYVLNNGSTGSITIPQSGMLTQGLYNIPVGTNNIKNMAANIGSYINFNTSGTGIREYSIFLLSTQPSNPGIPPILISETRKFIPDYTDYPVQFHLIWQNPLGVYDAHTFIGSYKKNDTGEKEMYLRSKDWEQDFPQLGYTDINNKHTIIHEVLSEFVSKEMLDVLWELRKSLRVWHLITAENKDKVWNPINLIAEERPREQFGQHLYEMSFKFIPSQAQII